MKEISPRYNINKHSKKFFIEINKYKENLSNNGLPVIYSLKHFALLLDMEHFEILNIIENREKYYRYFYLKKKSGGVREICTPVEKLKFIQQVIYKNILCKVILSDYCTGFRKKYSIKDNAKIHENNDIILKMDLLRFFDSISEQRVFGMFKELGYHTNLSVNLAKLTCNSASRDYLKELINLGIVPKNNGGFYYSRLTQGSPTSPIISNIILRKLDKRLGRLAERLGANYSRYADDLTFSGCRDNIPSIKFIEKIIQEEGFSVNHKKTNIQKKGSRQIVTGLTVTNGVHVPKKYKEDIKRHLYYCKKYGVYSHLNYLKEKKRINKNNFYDWLLGRIYYVKSVEPKVGKKMLGEFNKIDWNCTVNNVDNTKDIEGI